MDEDSSYLQLQLQPMKSQRDLDHPNPGSTTSSISILPPEVLLLILSRLSLTALIRSKYVCRSWRALVEQNPETISLKLSPFRQNPCLLFHCDHPLRSDLRFVDFSEESRKVRKLRAPFSESMPEFKIVGSCDGLLCAVDALYGDRVVVWNVFRGEYWELPAVESGRRNDEDVVFGFGRDSVKGECKVVRVSWKRTGRFLAMKSEVHVCGLESKNWRKLSGGAPHLLLENSSQPLVNGRLHWATIPSRRNGNSRIVSFDISDEQFKIVSQPHCINFKRSYFTVSLMEGCVATANVWFTHGTLDIWVMKVYDVAESWIKEYSIGPHVLKGLEDKDMDPFFKLKMFWSERNKRMYIRVLCVLHSGEILLEYHRKGLVCYDPKCDKAESVSLQGLPKWFESVVCWGS